MRPYVPSSTNLPELTPKAIALGVALSAILAGANAYLGLKVGLTVSASIPAAVISMALLRFFRESNILENNLVQTAASAGESVAAGVIFTLPALVLMGYWQGFSFWPVLMIALFGGTLGVLFTIPLRRALIVEQPLAFPEGVATAEVLKAGNEGGAGVKAIALAALAAAFLKLTQTGFKLVAPSAGFGVQTGNVVFGLGTDLGVALLAVGYIIGLNIATVVFSGGVIAWLVAIPLWMATAAPAEYAAIVGDATGYDAAFAVWSARVRYLGVGAMAVGGLWALISLLGPLRDGIKASVAAFKASRHGGMDSIERTERDTPIPIVAGGTVALTIPLFFVLLSLVDQDALGITEGLYLSTIVFALLFALVAGFLFSSVAGYMAGLVGSSNNPISGVTIATVLSISGIFLFLLGSEINFAVDTTQALAAAATAILVGAVVCCAAAIAGDNLQDLKAGQLVGATPWKQQLMQVLGVFGGAVAMAPVLGLLFTAYGLGDVFPRAGMNPAEALAAPQATLMASVARGVLGGELPWNMVIIGGVLAVVVIVLDQALKARKSTFRLPVLAVAVGLYLPIEVTTPIFLGGLLAYAVSRSVRRRVTGEAYHEAAVLSERRGLLFASGLITGEALVGILLAIPFAAYQRQDVLVFTTIPAGAATALGLVAYVVFGAWLYRVAARTS